MQQQQQAAHLGVNSDVLLEASAVVVAVLVLPSTKCSQRRAQLHSQSCSQALHPVLGALQGPQVCTPHLHCRINSGLHSDLQV